MRVKNIFDRASYENDDQFERVVDRAIQRMKPEEVRNFTFSLMRDCRGCGSETTYESTEQDMRKERTGFMRYMVCKRCDHAVPLGRNDINSYGRVVTLWNTTPLTIEARACA